MKDSGSRTNMSRTVSHEGGPFVAGRGLLRGANVVSLGEVTGKYGRPIFFRIVRFSLQFVAAAETLRATSRDARTDACARPAMEGGAGRP